MQAFSGHGRQRLSKILIVFLALVSAASLASGRTPRRSGFDPGRILELNRIFARPRSAPIPGYFPARFYWWWKFCPKNLHRPERRAGSLSRATIQQVMKRNRRKIRSCVSGILWDHPGVRLRFKVTFVVLPDGEATRVSVDSGRQRLPYVCRCLQRTIGRLKFPRPDGFEPVEITYPIEFEF
jgi:hypothetical protein